MGGTESKLNFRKAVVQLTTKKSAAEPNDDAFWDQFWSESAATISDVFTLIPAAEIRNLRDENPSNLATLSCKCVEKLHRATLSGCHSPQEQLTVLNCVRLLTRFIPYIFEDPDWRGFFWSTIPSQVELDEGMMSGAEIEPEGQTPLAQTLLDALADLCFCPEFTVHPNKKAGPEQHEDLSSIDSCEYIWEAGVGFATSPPSNAQFDCNRAELLKLLLTCFSEAMYLPPTPENHTRPNKWLCYFASSENRHALPLFTSILNTVCSYDPLGYGVPYNHLMFTDFKEPMVEVAAQLLVVLLDHDGGDGQNPINDDLAHDMMEPPPMDNLFCNYLSRIHREEDFHFILHGLANLLNNPLIQTYLPNSCKKISFHQELLILFWKMCDQNKKFLFYVLKSSDVLDILVPILYHLNDARSDQSRLGLMHIGVFILLLLSGERNFGVRLNKPYAVRVPMDIPVFTGTHADFLVVVFHKIITTGHQRLQPLFDCLLTIIVNVSPYLKSLSMVAANKLLHLLEAFSTPWFLFANPTNHHLVFFLLEIFNNIIQYQFDGNSQLVYAIIRKRNIFHQLANLPTDPATIQKPKRKENIPNMREGEHSRNENSTKEEHHPASLPEMSADMSVREVRHPGSESETSDVEGRSPEDPVSRATPGPSHTQKKAIGRSASVSSTGAFIATPEWVQSWKQKLPLQTIMRMLQVLVPQVEKICIDKGLTDESEIIKFLQHGTLVGLLPVPHPILIRKYQANSGTQMWFRTYMWGIIYLRNIDPPIWYDTDVKLFEIQRV
ncbi:protein HID1 [Nematostella vectensis]|uniref:protein HID1 n=1 Tax=Nematostella vectensis TaxID=45351 RepID=UPI0020771281|nr:protein HID1 [Nematostella vectensis]